MPKENPWVPTSEAIDIMKKYAQLVKDESLVKALEKYRNNPGKKQAKKIATMLHRNSHKQIIDYITNRFIDELQMNIQKDISEKQMTKSIS